MMRDVNKWLPMMFQINMKVMIIIKHWKQCQIHSHYCLYFYFHCSYTILGMASDDGIDTGDVLLMTLKGLERREKLNKLLYHRWENTDFLRWYLKIQLECPCFMKWFQFNAMYDKHRPKNQYGLTLMVMCCQNRLKKYWI